MIEAERAQLDKTYAWVKVFRIVPEFRILSFFLFFFSKIKSAS